MALCVSHQPTRSGKIEKAIDERLIGMIVGHSGCRFRLDLPQRKRGPVRTGSLGGFSVGTRVASPPRWRIFNLDSYVVGLERFITRISSLNSRMVGKREGIQLASGSETGLITQHLRPGFASFLSLRPHSPRSHYGCFRGRPKLSH
jgi:hypothetical protein